jgi:spermidine/putrescine transport system substrate-binding protein
MRRLLIATALLLAGTSLAAAEGVLNLYNWGNYTNPELLEKFEARTGVKVTVTDFDSNDTALAKIEAGGHGYDLVVPSATYLGIDRDKGLIAPLDHARLPSLANIAPEWQNPDWDPGRTHSVPWAWGMVVMAVNTGVYKGDIHTSAIILDPPEELAGRVNVTPEMSDVLALALMYVGAEPCTEDTAALKKARDLLMAAKPKWMSMDYNTIEPMSKNDMAATSDWNGAVMRARLANPDVAIGFPKEGYPMFADNVSLPADATNVDNAYLFLDVIMEPENAALISAFARYANGIAGSEPFMPEDMRTAPEVAVAPEHRAAGRVVPACGTKAQEYYTAIWTELNK